MISHAFWTRRSTAGPRRRPMAAGRAARRPDRGRDAARDSRARRPGHLTDIWLPNLMFPNEPFRAAQLELAAGWGTASPGVARETVGADCQHDHHELPGGAAGGQRAGSSGDRSRSWTRRPASRKSGASSQRPLLALADRRRGAADRLFKRRQPAARARRGAEPRHGACAPRLARDAAACCSRCWSKSARPDHSGDRLGVLCAAGAVPAPHRHAVHQREPGLSRHLARLAGSWALSQRWAVPRVLFGLVPALRASAVLPASHDARQSRDRERLERPVRRGRAGWLQPDAALRRRPAAALVPPTARRSISALRPAGSRCCRSRRAIAWSRRSGARSVVASRTCRRDGGCRERELVGLGALQGLGVGQQRRDPGSRIGRLAPAGRVARILQVDGDAGAGGARVRAARQRSDQSRARDRQRGLARRYFPGESAVGRLVFGRNRSGSIPHEIVGVVANTRDRGVRGEPPAFVFSPIAEAAGHCRSVRRHPSTCWLPGCTTSCRGSIPRCGSSMSRRSRRSSATRCCASACSHFCRGSSPSSASCSRRSASTASSATRLCAARARLASA